MVQLRIDDQLDELLELSFGLAEDQLYVVLLVAMPLSKAIFFEKPENVRASQVAFASPVDSLEKRHGAEFAGESIFHVESELQEVRFALHECLFRLNESHKEFAQQELSVRRLLI